MQTLLQCWSSLLAQGSWSSPEALLVRVWGFLKGYYKGSFKGIYKSF